MMKGKSGYVNWIKMNKYGEKVAPLLQEGLETTAMYQ